MPQVRVGWRSGTSAISASTLWNSIYAVYNGDSVGSSSLKTSLYAVYNGESNANDSFGTNNGTVVGGLTYTTGKIGNAFQFNGSNAYVSLPNNSLNLTGDFTVSFWVNLSSLTGHQFFISNVVNQSSLYRGFAIVKNNTTNLINVQFYNSNSSVDVFSSSAMVANTWYNIVLTRKSGVSTKLYVNGVLSGSNTSAMDPNYYTSQACQIGGYNNTASPATYFTNGSIDAVNVWQKELTQSEIAELYNSGNGAQYITDNFYKPTTGDELYNNNGTAQGGFTYGVGKVGTAFQFNGTNAYVQLPNNSLNFTGDFSISAWLYFPTDNQLTGADNGYILSNWTAVTWPSDLAGWSFTTSGNGIYFTTYNGTSTQVLLGTGAGIPALDRNGWRNIVFTRSGTTYKLWLDGGQYTATSTSMLTPKYAGTIIPKIGRLGDSTMGGWDSYASSKIKVDAVNIWNKALTATEITELYNSGNGKQYVSQIVPLLLDTYSGATVAYSLRKLRTVYSGMAIRVRRSSDNTERDIAFKADGTLDTASLLTFVGSGNGFVTTWYDQSGNGSNLIQNTAANQARIVYNGTLEALNGKPALVTNYNYSNSGYYKATYASTINGPATMFNIGSNVATAGVSYLWDGLNTSMYAYSYNSTWIRIGGSAEFALTGYGQGITTQRIINAIYNGASSKLRINNGTYATGNTGTIAATGLTLGAASSGSYLAPAYNQEHIVYSTNQEINAVAINTNINSYYSIY